MKKIKLLTALLVISTFAVSALTLKQVNTARETNAATTNADFGQFYDFLLTKNEHYTYSDQYIRQYQQASGGYIDLWKSLGGTVDKQNCIPNQHWHFFESWCKPSIKEGSFKFTASGSRGYIYFACPELQLWIIEASGVSDELAKQAYDSAISDKQNGVAVSTICANMRKIVPWSTINEKVLESLPANPNYHVSPSVDKSDVPSYTMSTIDYDGYQPGTNVTFTVTVNDSSKEIDSVTGTNVSITCNEGVYSFTMPSNHVDLSVTLKDKGGSTPTIKEGYKLVTKLDELVDGAQVIIGTPGSFKRNVAISTTQNANNRSNIVMVHNNGYYTVKPDQTDLELCVFTISSVTYQDKKYYQFYDSTNNGYLYVCSNSNNYLRTQETNNTKGYFEITNNAGVMNIVASVSGYSRNTIGNTASNFIGCGGGTTQTTIDLAIYTDVTATTKLWANNYVKMNDPTFSGVGTGLCKSEGLYANAKNQLVTLGVDYMTALKYSNDIDLNAACARYEAWAIANSDTDPYAGLISYNSPLGEVHTSNNIDNIFIAIVVISISSISMLLSIIYIKAIKRKHN